MDNKVLFVDDEPNVLQAYKRALRKQYNLDLAEGGKQALEMIASSGPYAVIVSDMRMPVMNGVELLATVKERSPNTVRMMLTGNADQQTAIDAINKGDIFRFLNKPCPPENLAKALDAGLAQHRLITAEKDLLEKTLRGSIKALTEVLSLVNPEAFGRTMRIASMTRSIAEAIGLKDIWSLEMLAMLSQIGCIILPEEVLSKLYHGGRLNEEEMQLFHMHPMTGADVIAKIPRMEFIAKSMRYQLKNYDGSGVPHDEVKGKDIPTGARVLHAVIDFDSHVSGGISEEKAVTQMQKNKEWYDPKVLSVLSKIVGYTEKEVLLELRLNLLEVGMTFAKDVVTKEGILLISKGYEVTDPVKKRLSIFLRNGEVQEPFYMHAPVQQEENRLTDSG